MTVTAVRTDPERLTMTVDAEFDASPDQVWRLWADPRKLERWWGPPTYPATFTSLDLRAGGKALYYMTSPEGERTPPGYWEIVAVDPPRRIEMIDGFANADGTPNQDMPGPGGMNVTIEPIGEGRTRMTIENTFPDVSTMEQLLAMGQEEGMKQAVGQIDAILAEDATPAGAR